MPLDKCPATRVLASQLNPSSAVINHLLLGRKPLPGPRGSRQTSTLPGARPAAASQSGGSPARKRRGSFPSNSTGSPGSSVGGAGSPWRAHVRVHRRNLARARAQLGFGDSEEREDEEEEVSETFDDDEERREAEDEGGDEAEQEDGGETSVSACEEAQQAADVAEVVVQLDSLDLEEHLSSTTHSNPDPQPTFCNPAPQVPLLPPPSSDTHKDTDRHFPSLTLPPPHDSIPPSSPSSSLTPPSTPSPNDKSNGLSALPFPAPTTFYKTPSPSTPSLSSASSSGMSHISSSPSTPAFTPSTSTPKQHSTVFSPFPCVKQPRRSLAARNLGLYGPTSRTPTVHFPQLSRNLNRSSAAGVTGRR